MHGALAHAYKMSPSSAEIIDSRWCSSKKRFLKDTLCSQLHVPAHVKLPVGSLALVGNR